MNWPEWAYYGLYNHLGSVAVVIYGDSDDDDARQSVGPNEIEQRTVYTPFGHKYWELRDATTNPDVFFDPEFGFTGQRFEELLDLTYFKARWYDQNTARFIQADTEFATGSDGPPASQALNRYSYTMNNPVMYTDPTGNIIVTSAILLAAAKGAVVGAVAGAATAAITGGDIGKGAAFGAIGGALGGGFGNLGGQIGGNMGGATGAEIGAIAGKAGGAALSASVTGGDPGLSAATAGVSAGVDSGLGVDDIVTSTGIGAIIGGVAAETQGGSFGEGAKNGAIGSATGFVTSAMIDGATKKDEQSATQNEQNATEPCVCDIPMEMRQYLAGGGEDPSDVFIIPEANVSNSDIAKYKEQNEAAIQALYEIHLISIIEQREYGGWIYENDDGTFSFTRAVKGNKGDVPTELMDSVKPIAGTNGVKKVVAFYHSHARKPLFRGPNFGEKFSGSIKKNDGDIGFVLDNKVDGYLVTPSGMYLKYGFSIANRGEDYLGMYPSSGTAIDYNLNALIM